MKKTKLAALIAIAALLIVVLPAAADNGNGGGVSVTVDGSMFYQDGTEDPLARLHDAWILPCGEDPEGEAWVYYYVFPHPDETWTDMGFDIAIVDYSWHYDEGGGPDFYDTAFGSCADEDEVVIPMMWLLTRGAPGESPPCILISETHPSRERQMALCFSNQAVWEPLGFYDPAWVADNAPCAGPVSKSSDNRGSWVCDGAMHTYNGARLPLFSEDGGGGKGTLYAVYQRHLERIGG